MSVEVYGGGGGASLKLQSKIVTPSTEQQIVTPDSGIDGLSKVTVNPMPGGTMGAPTVSSSGLITSRIEAGGYLNAGDSRTLQMSTRAGKTIVPATTDQVAIPARTYATGQITVKGDGNLVPGNIRNGVSIFNVLGTFAGDGNYEAFFGSVASSPTSSPFLRIPMTGKDIAREKIKAIIAIMHPGSFEGGASGTATLLWIYNENTYPYPTQVYIVDETNGLGLSTQFFITSNPGYIDIGLSDSSHYFPKQNYFYIVVAEV